MKDISELSACFNKYCTKMETLVLMAQEEATDIMLKEAQDRVEIPQEARNIGQFIAYSHSIEKKDPEKVDNTFISSVYSDLLVGGTSKWADVHIGAFLEWGTGRLGEASNEYEHGYDYTTDFPWDYHTELQFIQLGTWGIVARPHLYPAFVYTQPIFERKVREAVEKAWMK